MHPRNYILIGFFLVVLGVVIPFLMVVDILRPTYFYSFFSFAASVVGVMLGIVGGILYNRMPRN
jgi:hypothetical protein